MKKAKKPIWKDYFYYDETSPSGLRWATEIRRGSKYQIIVKLNGDIAGGAGVHGYWKIQLQGVVYSAHRIIWEMYYGEICEGFQIDHINGIRDDNRISNLRCVTLAENARNHAMNSNNCTGVVGVKLTNNGNNKFYYTSQYQCLEQGKKIQTHFSIDKYGKEEAFRLACEHRLNAINTMNSLGAGYTERHFESAREVNNEPA